MLKHIAIGMFIPCFIFLIYYCKNKYISDSYFLAKMPLIVFLCAIWSFVPSLLDKLPLGIINNIFVSSAVNNIFFFYGLIRKMSGTGTIWGLGLIFILFFSMVFIFIRHLRLQENELYVLKQEAK